MISYSSNKTIFIGTFLISLLFMLIPVVQAEDCTNATLIYGKAYFYNHEDDSQVINMIIEVYNTDVSGPTQHKIANTTTNSTGEYAIDISPNMTLQNQTFYVKAKYPDLIQTDGYRHFCYKSANVSCGNSSEVNFVVEGCYGLSLPTTVKGKIVYPNETSVPGEKTSVHVLVRGEGGGNFNILNTMETNWTGNDSNYKLSVETFQVLNPCPTYTDVNWPTDITVWMDPYQDHYYRCWSSSASDYKQNCTQSLKCGDDPEIKFYILNRKNNTETCSNNDECLSNNCSADGTCQPFSGCTDNANCTGTQICDQSTHTCQDLNCAPPTGIAWNHQCVNCTMNADCSDAQVCNPSTHTCQDLNCTPPTGIEWNHTCVNCTADAHCSDIQFCNSTPHECQLSPGRCSVHSNCAASKFCNATDYCQDKFPKGDSCDNSFQCETNYCKNGTCASSNCTADSDCFNTEFCNSTAHQCQIKKPNNDPCSRPGECQSDNCNNYSNTCLPQPPNYCRDDNDCCNNQLFNDGTCNTIQFCNSSNACQAVMINSDVSNSNITNSTVSNSNITGSSIENGSTVDNSVVTGSTIFQSTIIYYSIIMGGSTVANGSTINSGTITDGATIDNSTIAENSTVSNSTVSDSSVNESTVSGSAVSGSAVTDSAVTDASITNSTVTNSTVTDGATVDNSTIAENSAVTDSTVTDSTVTDGATVDNSTIAENSTVSGSTVTDSTITDGSTANNSTVSGGTTVTAGSSITNSTIDVGSTITNSTITNSNINNLTVNNAVITNDTLESGTIMAGDTNYTCNGSGCYINNVYAGNALNLTPECQTDEDCSGRGAFCDPLHKCRNLEILAGVYPDNGKTVRNNVTISIPFNPNDPMSSANLEVKFDNGTIENHSMNISNNSAYYSLVSLPDEQNVTVTATLSDAFGNNISVNRTFTVNSNSISVDYKNPTPEDGETLLTNNFIINLTADSINTCRVVINNITYNMTKTNDNKFCYYSLENLPDGIYEFTAYANDTNGDAGTTGKRTITIDASPPIPEITTTTTTNSATVTINFNENSNLTFCLTGISNFCYNSGDFNSSYTFPISGLSSGTTYPYTATFCDKGHCNSTTGSFTTASIGTPGPITGSSYRSSGGSGPAVAYALYCGDGLCNNNETAATCPEDCKKITCGDGICEGDETYSNCPSDCKKITCGDGICEGNETYETCSKDCPEPPVCGDNKCEGNESYENCPQDCPKPSVCGNKICEDDETYANCPADCKPICGDNKCELNETCENCPEDCKNCELVLHAPETLNEGESFTVNVTTPGGKPIKDARVIYGDQVGYTNINGTVSFTAAILGMSEATATKAGYNSDTKNVTIKKEPTGWGWLFKLLALLLLLLLIFFLLFRRRKKKEEEEEEGMERHGLSALKYD